MCADVMFKERDFANQTNAIYAAKLVYYAAHPSFLRRVLEPAGYTTADDLAREDFLNGDENTKVFFGVSKTCYVLRWFLYNAQLHRHGDLTELMRSIEMEC